MPPTIEHNIHDVLRRVRNEEYDAKKSTLWNGKTLSWSLNFRVINMNVNKKPCTIYLQKLYNFLSEYLQLDHQNSGSNRISAQKF